MRAVFHADDYAAYCHCPRKAFLLLSGHPAGNPHEYVRAIATVAAKNASLHLKALAAASATAGRSVAEDIRSQADLIVRPTVRFQDLAASPIALLAAKNTAPGKGVQYEPMLVAGTCRVVVEHKNRLNYIGYVLTQVQPSPPTRGLVFTADGVRHSVRLDTTHRAVESAIAALRTWPADPKAAEPPAVLNHHCPSCEFRVGCEEKARQADDLSLLDRMTPKLLQRYHKKGIFTVRQLSYVFRPRRSRKVPRGKAATFNVELQALAIRTDKIYLQQVPSLTRNSVELFLDIEGVPDRGSYYLFGVSVCDGNATSYHSYWADDADHEHEAFTALVNKLTEYHDAPIYHYGRYERQALTTLAGRGHHGVAFEAVLKRLVNISASIYGKVYFPVRSNRLKELGRYLGATWTSPEASGLQSLAWRHHWEASSEHCYKQMLLTYNEEDCRALQLLTNELSKVTATANSELSNVDFADRPKQQCSEVAGEIHTRFDAILKSATADYHKSKITLRQVTEDQAGTRRGRGGVKGHRAYQRIPPGRPGRIVRVRRRLKCPKHQGRILQKTDLEASKTAIDLVFSKNGCRRVVIKYVGNNSYCSKCGVDYVPPAIGQHFQPFGHAFQSWVIHQRITLRLPYLAILQSMEDLFGERIGEASIVSIMRRFAAEYAITERKIVRRILENPFVHADETRINIQGTDHYVWVFTNGHDVFFRMTETRESSIVHQLLANYKGVLISDFYPGYDGVACRQQKCWVHLIRDINEDLWKAPDDKSSRIL